LIIAECPASSMSALSGREQVQRYVKTR